MMIRKPAHLIALSSALALLTACSGGGSSGGGSSNVRPDDNGPSTVTYSNPDRVTISETEAGDEAQSTMVGVVDTGFVEDHPQIVDEVAATMDDLDQAQGDGGEEHGTHVAQIIAGKDTGYTGNADLLLARSGTSVQTDAAAIWTMEQGAEVVNLSLGPLYRSDHFDRDFFDEAPDQDALLVLAAGNYSSNISERDEADHPDADTSFFSGNYDYTDYAVIVGALDDNDELASYSDYAGENSDVQDRFLVASGTNTVQSYDSTDDEATEGPDGNTQDFKGTSSATPVVSAAAAVLRSYWPQLEADDIADILLSSADQDFSDLYDQNTCGESGDVNCGEYYFGSGKLDLQAAMEPDGEQSIPTGESAAEAAGYDLEETHVTLPAAFGDAMAQEAVETLFTDSYGRDYHFDLGQRFVNQAPLGFDDAMAGVLNDDARRVNADGSVDMNRNALGFLDATDNVDFGRYTFGFQHGRGGDFDAARSTLPMLALENTGSLSRYEEGLSFQVGYEMGEQWQLTGRSVQAHTEGENARIKADRHEVGVGFAPNDYSLLSLSVGHQHEGDAMMGASGSGGLGIGGTTLQTLTSRLEGTIGDQWALFSEAEVGRMHVDGQGVMEDISNATTSQFAAGVSWQNEAADRHFGLAVSQPIRVESAEANMTLPVAVNADGSVDYQTQSVSMTPSGRQINAELGFQQQMREHTTLGFNAVYAHDYGHVAGESDLFVMGALQHNW